MYLETKRNQIFESLDICLLGTFWNYTQETLGSELIEFGATIVTKDANIAVVGSNCAGDPTSIKAQKARMALSSDKIVTQEWVTDSMKV